MVFFVTFDDEIVRFSGKVVEIFMFDVDFMEDRKLVPRTVLEPLYLHSNTITINRFNCNIVKITISSQILVISYLITLFNYNK